MDAVKIDSLIDINSGLKSYHFLYILTYPRIVLLHSAMC